MIIIIIVCIQAELDLPASQIMGLFNRIIRKFVKFFTTLQEEEVGKSIPLAPPVAMEMEPVKESLDEELSLAAKELTKDKIEASEELKNLDLSQ